MTIGEALRDAAVRLEPVGGSGRLDAVFLLAHAGGVSRAEMIAHRDREIMEDFEDFLTLFDIARADNEQRHTRLSRLAAPRTRCGNRAEARPPAR